MLTRATLKASVGALAAFLAAPASAETLEEALAMAYAANPQLEITRAFTRIADESVVQARSAYGPSLDLVVSHEFAYTRNNFGELRSSDEGFSTTGTLTLQQSLLTFGRLGANLDLAQANLLAQRQALRGDSQQLILDVITAYVAVRRDIELYSVASDTYDLLLQLRDITASRLDLRDATAPDVDQTKNRVELAAARVLQARANLEGSAAFYRNLIGEYPDVLAPPPPLPDLPPLEELYVAADLNNPNLLNALFIEAGSRAQVALARAQFMPRVDASAQAGRFPLSPFSNSNYAEQVAAGVSLTVPLYAAGGRSSQVREALQRNIAAQNNLEQARRDVHQDLAGSFNRLLANEQSMPRYIAAVAAAQRAVEGVKEQERAGIRTLRDVLDVTNDLFNARTSLAQSDAERYIAHASVLRDIGMLSIDVFLDGAEYDPDSYSPPLAPLAGLPTRPLLEPIDELLVRDDVEPADVQIEDDIEYERGEALPYPLKPVE